MSIAEIVNEVGPHEGSFVIMMDMSDRDYNAHRLAYAIANDIGYYDESLDNTYEPKFAMWAQFPAFEEEYL